MHRSLTYKRGKIPYFFLSIFFSPKTPKSGSRKTLCILPTDQDLWRERASAGFLDCPWYATHSWICREREVASMIGVPKVAHSVVLLRRSLVFAALSAQLINEDNFTSTFPVFSDLLAKCNAFFGIRLFEVYTWHSTVSGLSICNFGSHQNVLPVHASGLSLMSCSRALRHNFWGIRSRFFFSKRRFVQ